MKHYKIILNIPNEPHTTEVSVNEEQLAMLEPSIENRKMIKIGDSLFNTAYIAKVVPDTEANAIEKPKFIELEKTTKTTSNKNNRQAIDELKKELFKKNIMKSDEDEKGNPMYYIGDNGEKMYS